MRLLSGPVWLFIRRLLDAQLLRCIEDGTVLDVGGAGENPVIQAMQALLLNDGLTS